MTFFTRAARLIALGGLVAVAAAGCKSANSAPPVLTPSTGPAWPLDKKIGAIVRLEDQRWLDDGAGANLLNFVTDGEPVVRRRAAIAIGRVGLPAGVPALVGAAGDSVASVRAAAVFSLGLLRATSASATLTGALTDADPEVRARAADAIGLAFEATTAPGARAGGAGTPAAGGAPERAAIAGAVADAAAGCRAIIAPLAPAAGAEDLAQSETTPDVVFCRAAILAVTRLRDYPALARIVLDANGAPVSAWWPVAYGLQRVRDKRGAPALAKLVNVEGPATAAFAIRGLADYGDTSVLPAARTLAAQATAPIRLRAVAIDALGRLKDPESIALLGRLINDRTTPQPLLVDIATALGATGLPAAFDVLADQFRHKWAPLRAAAMAAAARVAPDDFLLIASGLGLDKDWSVRASLAGTLATLDPERVRDVVTALAEDEDARVRAAGLEALARVGAPDLEARVVKALDAPDFAVRATAARIAGRMPIADAASRLAAAYERGTSDANDAARSAALSALAGLGADAATPTLRAALDDPSWPVRLEAEQWLRRLGDASATAVRPAPLRLPVDFFDSPALLRPQYTPHAFVETRLGTIEIELNVVEAPIATHSFMTLARKGFFNGMRIHRVVPNFVVQAGDDRGDGEGGPGYALRDELSALPYLRGTVGMALGGPDTGGSQFFITLSPQPHLDGKYAVFGRVVRGMDLVDQLSRWDVIQRLRVWDGVSF
jgi:cyclophilin family peptidyl-prolyl cis-trans isomerase/HEAT repeat protein